MQVVTVSSELNNPGFVDYLKPSCAFYKLDLIVLEYDDVFFSNRLKDALLEEYLKQVPDDEIILFTDASDTAFVAGEQEILDKYNSFNASLVFSAEMNCWPNRLLGDQYPPSLHHFKYLNCGGFIGRAAFLKKLYRDYPIFSTVYEDYKWSNQYYWNHVYLQGNEGIKIDHDCSIFYNTAIPLTAANGYRVRNSTPDELELVFKEEKERLNNEIMFTGKRLQSTITNSNPCHIHFPGPVSKLLMQRGYFDSLKV